MSSITATAAQDVADLQTISSFALLSFDSYPLLLPQRDIALLELSADLDHLAVPEQYNVASLNFQGQSWPTYCLTSDFSLRKSIPSSRYICAVLNDNENYLGLLCDTIDTLAAAEFHLHPIPFCMQQNNMLASALAVRDEEMLVLTTAARLHQFIHQHQHVEQHNG